VNIDWDKLYLAYDWAKEWQVLLAGLLVFLAAVIFAFAIIRSAKLRAQVRFLNTEALIDSLHFEVDSIPIQLRGRLTTSPPVFGLTLTPEKGAIELVSLLDSTADLSSIRVLGEGRSDRQPHLQLAFARGTLWPPFVSSLTITTEEPGHLLSFQTTYFFRPRALDASPLLLRSVPAAQEAGFELEETERELAPRAETSP